MSASNPRTFQNLAGAGPWVAGLTADRGQARLQVAPIPSLLNLGRVGDQSVTRPAFLEVTA